MVLAAGPQGKVQPAQGRVTETPLKEELIILSGRVWIITLRAQQSQGQVDGTAACPAGHLQQDTHISLPATPLSSLSPRSHRAMQEGPGHPGKVSERGCTAQGSIGAQHRWPHGSWGCHSLPKPLASLSPTQHVLGKVTAVTAVTQ